MLNTPIILGTKTFSKISQALNLGSGSTWPGHIALKLNNKFIQDVLRSSHTKVIFVAGTNGKTTTSSLIEHILSSNNKHVIRNNSGANLINGIASTLIQHANSVGKITADFAIFEVDENTLPKALLEITPDYIVLLNLFRDQLDRYGEVNTIATKWRSSLIMLPSSTTLILNADDPQVAYLGKNFKGDVLYFGLDNKKLQDKSYQHAADSIYCPNCGNKLEYKTTYFSHLGDYVCKHCKFKRPILNEKDDTSPLPGTYNIYNTMAGTLTTKTIGVNEKYIQKALSKFTPAFGRQEVISYHGKNAQLFLSKNPTSFNQSFKTIIQLQANTILITLNDRVPDGRDVSWIWDTDIEEKIDDFQNIIISGDRCYDMGLRIKYAMSKNSFDKKVTIFESLEDAVKDGSSKITSNETLFILPTYSAMLDVRKILTGKKIL